MNTLFGPPKTGMSQPVRTPAAIYCRKSIEEEREEEKQGKSLVADSNGQQVRSLGHFGSLKSQRSYGENLIKSRAAMGWEVYPGHFDDDGFSGGDTDRPALQRLLRDAEKGRFKVVVVYRLDRLSRSIRDFLELVDKFDKYGVTLVSVTESFDTSTSIGRLIVMILMSFAQFEREVIGERTRDKLAMAARNGRRLCAIPILGYDLIKKQLIKNVPEAKIVKELFETYLKMRSLSQVIHYANSRGYRTKRWETQEGLTRGGKPLSKTTLVYMFDNCVYTGKIRHKGEIYPGLHEGIIEPALFEAVGALLRENQNGVQNRSSRRKDPHLFLLKHLVKCGKCGAMMSPHYNGRGVTYYKCHKIMKLDKTACVNKAANAPALHQLTLERLRFLGRNAEIVEKIVDRARAMTSADLPQKRAERDRLRLRAGQVETEIRNLVAVIARDGTGAANLGSLTSRIAELERERAAMNEATILLDAEIESLAGETIEADLVRASLLRFDELFGQLEAREQQELIRLIVKEIVYDGSGEEGRVQINLRPLPLQGLALDEQGRLSNSVQNGCRARIRT